MSMYGTVNRTVLLSVTLLYDFDHFFAAVMLIIPFLAAITLDATSVLVPVSIHFTTNRALAGTFALGYGSGAMFYCTFTAHPVNGTSRHTCRKLCTVLAPYVSSRRPLFSVWPRQKVCDVSVRTSCNKKAPLVCFSVVFRTGWLHHSRHNVPLWHFPVR